MFLLSATYLFSAPLNQGKKHSRLRQRNFPILPLAHAFITMYKGGNSCVQGSFCVPSVHHPNSKPSKCFKGHVSVRYELSPSSVWWAGLHVSFTPIEFTLLPSPSALTLYVAVWSPSRPPSPKFFYHTNSTLKKLRENSRARTARGTYSVIYLS